MTLAHAIATMLPLLAPRAQDHATRHAERSEQLGSAIYELPPGGEPARVPFHLLGNQVRLDATIEGQGPFRLILDTGMPMPGIILFRSDRVDALHLDDTGERVGLSGAGSESGSTEASVATGAGVVLGDLKLRNVEAMIMSPPSGFPSGVDGVIGGALFFRFVVRVDMDQERLELSEPKGWSPPAGACVVPLENLSGKIFVDIRVAVGPEEPIPAHVVVDLGAGHALSLNTSPDGRFAPGPKAIDAPLGRGISGVVLGKIGRARRVEIGSFAFEDALVSFPSRTHQRPGGFDFRDGNLGAEILKRFNVTFDYAGSRLVLEEAKGFRAPFEREMAGLAFTFDQDGTLAVLTVLPGSPAATVGIAEGDHVLSIDGQSVGALGENGVRKALTSHGAEVSISLRRGTETIERKLRLKRLV